MSIDVHTVAVVAGQPARTDRILLGMFPAQGYAAGAGAGAASTLTIAGAFPATYMVFLGLGADAVGEVLSKTQTGFTISVSPRLAANTLAAGVVDVLVIA